MTSSNFTTEVSQVVASSATEELLCATMHSLGMTKEQAVDAYSQLTEDDKRTLTSSLFNPIADFLIEKGLYHG